MRVLFVDDKPRWEYRYIRSWLLRSRGIELQAWLCDAGPTFSQDHSPREKPLTSLPRTASQLAKYDVILIGDVEREDLGRTPREQAAWCRAVVDFVWKGGGVAFLAGERAMPLHYRGLFDQTLLPVFLEPPKSTTRQAPEQSRDTKTRPGVFRHAATIPTPVASEQRLHPILRMGNTDAMSLAIWRRMPAVRMYLPVRKLKPGASALLQHAKDRNEFGPRILAAVGRWEKGRTFFIATDETWLWLKPHGERYRRGFWLNVVRHLAGRDPEGGVARSCPTPDIACRLVRV